MKGQRNELMEEEYLCPKDEKAMKRYTNRIWNPKVSEFKGQILSKSHDKIFSARGSTEMYQDLKQNYWWPNMKREIVDWVSKYLTCQKMKAEHHRPSGLL